MRYQASVSELALYRIGVLLGFAVERMDRAQPECFGWMDQFGSHDGHGWPLGVVDYVCVSNRQTCAPNRFIATHSWVHLVMPANLGCTQHVHALGALQYVLAYL